MTLGDHKDKLVVGKCFNYLGYYDNGKPQPSCFFDGDVGRWEVERVEERGILVSHPNNPGAHQHFLEWNKPLVGIKFA